MAAALAISVFASIAPALEKDIDLSLIAHRTWAGTDDVPPGIAAFAHSVSGPFFLAGEGGVYKFDGMDWNLHTAPDRKIYSSTRATASCLDAEDALWVGYAAGFVDRVKGLVSDHFAPEAGRQTGRVYDIACAGESVWVASDGGLARWRDGQWTVQGPGQGLPEGPVLGLLAAKDGALWVAMADAVHVATRESSRFKPVALLTSAQRQRVSLARTRDWLWIGTSESLARVPIAQTEPVRAEVFRPGRVTALLADREDVLWVGGADLERFVSFESGTPAQRKSRVDGLSGKEVRQLFEDREGNVWASTGGGLDRFSRTPFVGIPIPDEFRGPRTLISDDAALWVGITEQDLVLKFLDGREVQRIALRSPQIGLRDRRGAIWFAGPGGASQLLGNRFVTHPFPPGIHVERVRAFASDRDGTLWAAILPAGLLRYSGGRWQSGSGVEGLPEAAPVALDADAAGNLWLGYDSGQVFRLAPEGVREFGMQDGLDGGGITMVRASASRVWIGAEQKLGFFDGDKITATRTSRCGALRVVADVAETPSGGVWLYRPFSIAYAEQGVREMYAGVNMSCPPVSRRDGVKGAQHTYPGLKAVAVTTDGRMWISTEDGLAWSTAERLAETLAPPHATIERMETGHERRDRKEVAPGMTFPPGTRTLQMSFSAWRMSDPTAAHFRHRLVKDVGRPGESDEEWTRTGNDNSAYHSNLGPGRYRIEVQASSSGTLNWGRLASLPFVIQPYFYETLWFRGLVVLAVLGVIAWLLRAQWNRQSRRLRERLDERLLERERIARELHDTLLQGVQGLVLQFQAVAAYIPRTERAAGMMDEVLDRADGVITESRDRISLLRETPPDTCELPEALAEAASVLVQGRDTATETEIVGDVRPLDGSVNSEMFLIAREALNNAVQHAGATRIVTDLCYERFWLRLRVRDNGVGISDEVLRNGSPDGHFGLDSMRERAERLRGTLRVSRLAGGGTEVELRVPAALAYPKERR